MADIVERLRDGDTTRRIGESYADVHDRRQSDRYEAADEITRLRAEVEQNKIDLEEYRRDVERLRAALELFACDCKGEELCFNTDNCRNFKARAALEEK